MNLVDQKGHELPVKEAYERNVKHVSLESCVVCSRIAYHSTDKLP